MAKSYEQKVVLFKLETTEGTDAVPTAAANAFRVLDYSPVFMSADGKVRNVDKGYLGANPTVLSAFRRGATFNIEMAGSGVGATTPAAWMLLNQMCGFGAGAVGGSSVIQSGSAVSGSMTHYALFLDEQDATKSFRMKASGGKATLGFRITDDDFPVFTYNYMGIPPTALADEVVFPTATIANQADPVVASSENTTFSLDGYALPLRSIEASSNADIQLRSLIGPADFMAYRQDGWTGSIVAEVPGLTAKDYFAKVRPGTTMAMAATHGTVAGNIVEISAPRVQITGDVALSEEQGKLMMTLPVTFLPNAGNDEVVFTSK